MDQRQPLVDAVPWMCAPVIPCSVVLVRKVSKRCVNSDPCFGASLATQLTPPRRPSGRKTEAAAADWPRGSKPWNDVWCRFWTDSIVNGQA